MGQKISSLCEDQPDTRPKEVKSKLVVWGDYYNPDTRVVLACLKLAGVAHEQVMMNTLANEHKEAKVGYDKVNPSG